MEWWWHLYSGDGGRREKTILHLLCVLNCLLDVLLKGVELAKLNLFSSHEWLGLSTQPTPREIDRKIGRDELLMWFWMGELSLEEISMKSVHGIFFGGFWIEEFALEAMKSWKTRPFSLMLESKDSLLGKRDHHVIYKIEFIRVGIWVFGTNIFKESSEKHSIGKSHVGTFGHTYHSVDDVVGKVEIFHRTKHRGSKTIFHEVEDKSRDENQHHFRGMGWAIRECTHKFLDYEFKNPSELLKRKSYFEIVDDEGNGNSSI
uniref:Uncharacterized protein n=1 Tax=Tanacetum cinerariifolium TaxID=118510 RepID=A0A699H3L4_TANCI|nr:hypothetical protein [Tanacetum cinerariifolium]